MFSEPGIPALVQEAASLGSLSLLPKSANNVANCNTLPFTQDALVTSQDRQYAVWVSGADRAPLLSYRFLSEGGWVDPVSLQEVPGTAFDGPTKLDPHHSYALGADASGRLHLAGNHHNEPLRYMRSDPEDPLRWSRGAMIGSNEESVTYPTFVRMRSGALLFAYRDGRAGYGDIYLNSFDGDANEWERLGMLVDGRRTEESPYLNHVVVADDGAIHVSGCFRRRGGKGSHNRDIWHIASRDEGTTWQAVSGETLELPISHGTVPIAVRTKPHGSGLVNQTGMDVGPEGHPFIGFLRYDARGATQVALAWHDGDEWRDRDITRFGHRIETDVSIVDAAVARPAVVCDRGGDVWLITRVKHEGHRNNVWCYRATPDRDPVGFTLYEADLGGWEPILDTNALRERHELHLLLSEAPPYSQRDPRWGARDWSDRPIGVLSLRVGELADALDARRQSYTF